MSASTKVPAQAHAPSSQEMEGMDLQQGISHESGHQLAAAANNSPNVVHQRQLSSIANASPQVAQQKEQRAIINGSGAQNTTPPVQRSENRTGMSDELKEGVEGLSGMDLSDVRVKYNSSEPAQLNAHAFARGNEIHIASGQEKHLPEEAWHVVQQKQNRVSTTTQVNGKAINDDPSLEKEAVSMGNKAAQFKGETGPLSQASAASGSVSQLAAIGDRPFDDGYQDIFSDPEWEQKTMEFEKRLGVYAYNSPQAQAAAQLALNRLRDVILEYYHGQGTDDEIMREAFLRDDPGSAGQIGTQATDQQLQDIFAGGNLRERMTAFYNGAYYKTGEQDAPLSKSFKAILHDITLGDNQQAAHDLALDEAGLQGQREFLNGWTRWGIEKSLQATKPGIAYNFSQDIFALGNLTYQQEGMGSSVEIGRSQSGRTPRPEADRRDRQKESDFYDNMGVPLSERERLYQGTEMPAGVQGPVKGKLDWLEGGTYYQLDQDSAWVEKVRRRMGMPVVAGVSGTTTRMLSAFQWLNTGGDILDFRAAVMGWMLPHWDHSLYEILRGSHMGGVNGGETLDDITKMYTSVPPFTEAQIRANVAENGMLPHELIYMKKVNNGDFKETADKTSPTNPAGPKRAGTGRIGHQRWGALNAAKANPADPLHARLAAAGTTADEVTSNITEAQAVAITNYTGGGHALMNAVMNVENLADFNISDYIPAGRSLNEMGKDFLSRKALEHKLNTVVDYFGRYLYLRAKPAKTAEETAELAQLQQNYEEWPGCLEPIANDVFTGLAAQGISEEERAARREALRPRVATIAGEIISELKAQCNMTVEGLSKLPSIAGEIVWRGDWDYSFIGFKYQGDEISVPQFTSTTRNKATAEGFARRYSGGNASGAILLQLTLTGKGGKDVNYLSAFQGEGEILLMPGTKFRIADRLEKADYTLIRAVEV